MPTLEEIKALTREEQIRVLQSLPTDQLQALKSKPATPKIDPLTEKLNQLPTDQLIKLKQLSPEARNDAIRKLDQTSFGEDILNAVTEVGRFIDRYTGAPARAAVGALIPEAKPPAGRFTQPEEAQQAFEGLNNIPSAIAAFGKQFGEEPELAPTGKELATKLGFSTEPTRMLSPGFIPRIEKTIEVPSAAGIVGFGLDVALDPTNLLPVTTAAKVATKGTKALGGIALKGSAKAAEAATRLAGAGKVVDIGKESVRGTKAALGKLFNPKVAEDFTELKDIAKANNIDVNLLPESIEFGPTSLISRASRVQREGLLGEELLTKFEDGLQQVRNAVDNKITQIGGGPALNDIKAGSLLRDAWDRGAQRLFDDVDVSYSKVIKDYPGLKLSDDALSALQSKLKGIEKFAKGRARRGLTRSQKSQGEQLLESIDTIKNTLKSSKGSFKQTYELLRDIGDAAFQSKNAMVLDPPDIRKLRGLYDDVRSALVDTIRTDVRDGESIAGALQINNDIMHKFFGDKSQIANILGNKTLGAEEVFNSLIKRGSTADIAALKNVVSPEDWSKLKASLVNSLIKRDVEGGFTFRSLANNIRQKANVLEEALTPQELSELSDIVRLGDRFGPAVMSSSGTGASNIISDIYNSTKQGITNDAFIDALKDRARKAGTVTGTAETAAAPEFAKSTRSKLALAIDEAIRAGRLQSIQQTNERRGFALPGGQ